MPVNAPGSRFARRMDVSVSPDKLIKVGRRDLYGLSSSTGPGGMAHLNTDKSWEMRHKRVKRTNPARMRQRNAPRRRGRLRTQSSGKTDGECVWAHQDTWWRVRELFCDTICRENDTFQLQDEIFPLQEQSPLLLAERPQAIGSGRADNGNIGGPGRVRAGDSAVAGCVCNRKRVAAMGLWGQADGVSDRRPACRGSCLHGNDGGAAPFESLRTGFDGLRTSGGLP